MAAEVEKAPARRGRPPGSKNKVQKPAAVSTRKAKGHTLDVLPEASADALVTALFGTSDEPEVPPVVFARRTDRSAR